MKLHRLYETAGTDQTQTPEFKRWFGASKVVDGSGKPLVVYHGTSRDFSQFNRDSRGVSGYFTDDRGYASEYGGEKSYYLSIKKPLDVREFESQLNDEGIPKALGEWEDFLSGNGVTGVRFGSAFNLFDDHTFWEIIEDPDVAGNVVERIEAAGYDGVVQRENGSNVFVAFHPTQIKSATGNDGSFDPANPDIRH